MSDNRAESSYGVRVSAAELARHRVHPIHKANGDEERYASAHYLMSFTKGLRHDHGLGVVAVRNHFEAMRHAIDYGYVKPFTTEVPAPMDPDIRRRQWEAPTAGTTYDLQGPDAQAVTMAPAPALCSDELAFEMAEVYELALLRDTPLSAFADHTKDEADLADAKDRLSKSIGNLQGMPYADNGFAETCGSKGRPRKTETNSDGDCVLTPQTAFRGSSPGVDVGPYLSQFMWIGNKTLDGKKVGDGFIQYGAQCIEQTVPKARPGVDYMTTWDDWIRVQDGFDVNHAGVGQVVDDEPCGPGQRFHPKRFIYTPRDLATYVHFDALYQAYLNATLILLAMGTPFDPGFAHLSGMRGHFEPMNETDPSGDASGRRLNAGGFALYGGPHILSLVTEVATRALKAVRFQKFNNHLRLRPEALAGRIAKAQELDAEFPQLCGAMGKMCDQMAGTLGHVKKANPADANLPNGNFLLPMAFAEGSPMHPTYGAGHATVAGACTTIVKAFFDTGTVLGQRSTDGCGDGDIGFYHGVSPRCFEAIDEGASLDCSTPKCPLTLEGELNKLAANISIGRNMAGVHYFSDYYDSLRMGEEIAIGMLEEQALCYATDDFVLSVPTFDGEIRRIGRK
ncbi:MAG: vanadium-dependent haloperoxidase [Pseudomonadota bacterium]